MKKFLVLLFTICLCCGNAVLSSNLYDAIDREVLLEQNEKRIQECQQYKMLDNQREMMYQMQMQQQMQQDILNQQRRMYQQQQMYQQQRMLQQQMQYNEMMNSLY